MRERFALVFLGEKKNGRKERGEMVNLMMDSGNPMKIASF